MEKTHCWLGYKVAYPRKLPLTCNAPAFSNSHELTPELHWQRLGFGIDRRYEVRIRSGLTLAIGLWLGLGVWFERRRLQDQGVVFHGFGELRCGFACSRN